MSIEKYVSGYTAAGTGVFAVYVHGSPSVARPPPVLLVVYTRTQQYPGTNCCKVRISIYQVLLTAVTYNLPGFVCCVDQVQLLRSSTCSPLCIWHADLVPVRNTLGGFFSLTLLTGIFLLVTINITGVHNNQDQMWLVKIGKYIGFYVDLRS